MDETANLYLKKTVFWQRFAAVVLTAFLVTMWIACVYYFMDFMNSSFRSEQKEVYAIFAIFFGYLGLGTYLDFVLFQASSSLNRYLKFNDMRQLELAFRKQRHFWMGLTLMVLSVFLVAVLFAIMVSYIR